MVAPNHMTWDRVALYINCAIGGCLISRLLFLRLHKVYAIFSFFLFSRLFGGLLYAVDTIKSPPYFDYRMFWIVLSVIDWVMTLCMLYALLEAMLATLPGVLKFSRKLLHLTFVCAGIISAVVAWPQVAHAAVAPGSAAIDWAVPVGMVIQQVISTSALIALTVMLSFIIWFPVQMPRNLVLFSFGFFAFFAQQTATMILYNVLSSKHVRLLSVLDMSVLSACFIYWLFTITKQGEAIPLRVGHAWEARQQRQMIEQLENMNAALARNAR